MEELATEISRKYNEVKAGKIVLGLPKHMSGDEGTHAGKVRELGTLLETKLDIKVDYLDERLTSISAEKILIEGNVSREKRKQRIDTVAACIILQSYLDANSSNQ
jgi:putative Holliday junction resolvase